MSLQKVLASFFLQLRPRIIKTLIAQLVKVLMSLFHGFSNFKPLVFFLKSLPVQPPQGVRPLYLLLFG